jgi:UDP:flavonoid glycosyltransferase YjiC (YdhE family)
VLGAVPSNTRVAKWVDHDEVFRDASLVVCHGGSGTVFGALAAGVPLVVVPSFADQFDNGRKVTRAGAGEVVVARTDGLEGARRPVDLDDGPRITAAIERVASSRSYRDAAGRIADEMASSPSAAGALAAVEAMLAR